MTPLNLSGPHVIVAFNSTSSALILDLLSSLICSVESSPAHWMNWETEYWDTRTALYLGVVVSAPKLETGWMVQSKPGPVRTVGGPVGTAGGPVGPGPFWGDGEQRSRFTRKKKLVRRREIKEGIVAGERRGCEGLEGMA